MSTIRIRHFINGEWIAGEGNEFSSTSPARPNQIVAAGRFATAAQVEDAIAAADESQPEWARLPIVKRAEVLKKAAVLLRENASQWGRELSLEEGKTAPEGIGEVNRAADILDFQATEAVREAGEIYHSPRKGERIEVVRKPVGVVSMITPFNFPIAIPAWKAAPALIHGNAIVWKPAHSVPLLALRLTQALESAGLPAGILNLVVAPSSETSAMLVDPRIKSLTFTGSTQVGRSIASKCAAHGIPVQAEMGGKNPAIVLADADLTHAAAQVIAGAFNSTGQKCTATSRVAVVKEIAADFKAELLKQLSSRRTGDPLAEGIAMGPLIDEFSRDSALEAVQRNLGQSTKLLAGGNRLQVDDCPGGYFMDATVVEIDSPDNELWVEELFAPVLALLVVDTEREAFKVASAGEFGLSAAVFTNSLHASFDAIDLLDVGILHINSETAGADPHVPFGGAGASGLGPKEQGRAAREFFTHTTTVYLGRGSR